VRIFGLIGKSLDHSWSKSYFSDLFKKESIKDCRFEDYPMNDLSGLRDMIRRDITLAGLCVTLPYKVDILNLLDEIDISAINAGAANCLKISRSEGNIHIKGYNTDSAAFKESLIPLITGFESLKAMVLGTGGAARAVGFALQELSIPHRFVSRNKTGEFLTYEDIDGPLISSHLMIINATPLGMYPESLLCPAIPYNLLGSEHLLYDLIYNPVMSLFLKKGSDSGARTKNGLEMLQRQAYLNWKIWNKE
jgi:shikimate dehydrogenase